MTDHVDPADEGETKGEGAGTEGRKPKDQDTVPRARLDQEIANRRRQELELAELKGRLEAVESRGSNGGGGGDKVWTASELREAVEEGQITQAQADDIVHRQTQQEIDKRVRSAIEANTKETGVRQEAERYLEALPDINVEGSEMRAKFLTEYNWLLQRGYARDDSTALLAMRTAFGDVSQLGAAPKGEREPAPENAGSQEEPGGEGGEAAARWPKWMSKRQRDYYDGQIARGFYKDRKDCIEKMKKYGSDRSLQKYAALERPAP